VSGTQRGSVNLNKIKHHHFLSVTLGNSFTNEFSFLTISKLRFIPHRKKILMLLAKYNYITLGLKGQLYECITYINGAFS
jgi:hypothetical protein